MDPIKSSHSGNSTVTIFVVDDEPMLLDLAATILQPMGYNVRTYRDPQKALKEYSKVRPLLLVTDYSMEGMNGLELLHECRQINPAQKVLLLSGTVDETIYANEPDKPDMYLAKPYKIRDLVEALKSLMKT
jgi:CheY-like chemotaxis protein